MLSTGGAICAEPRKQFLRQPGTLLYGIQDNVLLENRQSKKSSAPPPLMSFMNARKSSCNRGRNGLIALYRSRAQGGDTILIGTGHGASLCRSFWTISSSVTPPKKRRESITENPLPRKISRK